MENSRIGSIRSTRIENGVPSNCLRLLATSGSTATMLGTTFPIIPAPAINGPSNSTPCQLPNCLESLIACHTRSSGARNRIFFSTRPVSVPITQSPSWRSSSREREVLRNQLHLVLPSTVVRLEGPGTPLDWNLVETRLRDRQHCAAGHLFQLEY